MRSIIALLVALGALALAPPLAAEPPVASFSPAEIEIIRDYYRDHRLHEEPRKGGKKHKQLPPGIAKNLARGKPLPPGIAKRYLPDDLSGRLPVYPGYERIIVDERVLLVEIATGVVRDVLFGVLGN